MQLNTIKRETLKQMRNPYIQHVLKDGTYKVRKKELQQMVCIAQLKVKGKLSPSVSWYIDTKKIDGKEETYGVVRYEMSTGFYNVAFASWVSEGLLTRNAKDGYKITDLGILYSATDTRAYEIEMWKNKFKSQKKRCKELWRSLETESLELEYYKKRVDEIYFGEEFMDSDDKGSLQTYDGNYNSPLKSSPPNSIVNSCLSNMQESLDCITQHYNKE
tara:strand:- start:1792 stop:2442 length:651 start_codon:yes stop_codon:yes gene_type:complete